MVIDEDNKGVPIAFILFTPSKHNRLISSGYDSKTLEQLFTIFRDRISDNYNKNQLLSTSIIFKPLVAMTDTDVKERKPLAKIWPEIILLLCFFHISQCYKNEINKQLDRGGDNKVILLRKTVKMFLKSTLKEAQSIDCNEQMAGDLLYSWCLNGWMKAAEVLGIPLEKLPTTNNHLERMNEYLKNNQLNRFQRNHHLLRADIFYIALVYEVIPNILILRNLAKNLEQFLQVAHLSPSTKYDESAKKLLEMEKVIKYEVEEISEKIYVEVESETTPGFVYTTCVYGQPTDICCQCFDFFQMDIICKHLRAAALYLNKLRKQEPYKHLPKMIFSTYQKAQNIYHSQYDNKSKVLVGSENEDDISNKSNEDTNNESNYYNNNDDN
ncbi:16312_t:CDS:2 [Racocetra persica]|uniref:16312_t:CDS:1 n=1 Tax=Racocetra persica TaxID=160502 RepID=A0ACA9QNY5_9GLOM|nr:16312_t:CDS:2 [Racocetra persica]